MKTFLRATFGITLAVAITACREPRIESAVLSPMWIEAPQAPEGKALMTFFRPGRFYGAVLNTSIFIDEVEIADLDNGTYVTAAVAAGRHAIHGDEAADTLSIAIEPGREYFYRVDIVTGAWKGHGRLIERPGLVGQAEFRKAKPSQASDVRVPAMVIRSPSEAID